MVSTWLSIEAGEKLENTTSGTVGRHGCGTETSSSRCVMDGWMLCTCGSHHQPSSFIHDVAPDGGRDRPQRNAGAEFSSVGPRIARRDAGVRNLFFNREESRRPRNSTTQDWTRGALFFLLLLVLSPGHGQRKRFFVVRFWAGLEASRARMPRRGSSRRDFVETWRDGEKAEGEGAEMCAAHVHPSAACCGRS